MTHIHIIGGGLAGLSAAVELAGSGVRVSVHEAGPACGGRARSYEDRHLGCRIDNGNHLLLSANHAAFRYLGLTGAHNTLSGPGVPYFPWVDLKSGGRWTLDLSLGKLPFWALSTRRRVPDMRLWEFGSLMRLMKASGDQTVAECLAPGALSDRLLAPFAISALNTMCEDGSAALLGGVIRESLAQGGRACVPWYATEGLSESFVDPALSHLALMKAEVHLNQRISAIEVTAGRATALVMGNERIELAQDDHVIMAVPPWVARSLLTPHLPEFTAPDRFEAIINAHFRLSDAPQPGGSIARAGFAGVVGGITEWVFVRNDVVSVTVSAANRYADLDVETLEARIWSEVRAVLDPVLDRALPDAPLAARIVREKRATFAATPDQERLRPGAQTSLQNLVLAGDWTATGLPCTIEGAIRSGVTAAAVVRKAV